MNQKRLLSVLVIAFMVIPVVPFSSTSTALDAYGTNLSDADAIYSGEKASDQLGIAVAIVGDVNGDGIEDAVFGAPGASFISVDTGKAYLMFGKKTGWSTSGDITSADVIMGGGSVGDRLGDFVAPAGDVNGDGYDDILVAATGWDPSSGDNWGIAYVVMGRETWQASMDISNEPSFIGEANGDLAGRYSSGVGDVNGDGFDDIVLGALLSDDGGTDAGVAYLIWGHSENWNTRVDLSNADVKFRTDDSPGDHLGQCVAGGGDVNGDGYDDFLISATYNDTDQGISNAGMVYLFLGHPGDWPSTFNVKNADASWKADEADGEFGSFSDIVQDVNGDGMDDLLLTHWSTDIGQLNVGRTNLVYGRQAGWPKNALIHNVADAWWNGTGNDDNFGVWTSDAGDVNGDGFGDFIASAYRYDDSGTNDAGQTYLFTGRQGTWTPKANSASDAAASWIGEGISDLSGSSTWGGGDVNGDGYDDIVIGAYNTNTQEGKVYLVFPDENRRPFSIDSLKLFDASGSLEVSTALPEDGVLVIVEGADTQAGIPNVELVKVQSESNPVGIVIGLHESGPNTGMYWGTFILKNRTNRDKGWIKTTTGENITVTAMRDSNDINATLRVGATEIKLPQSAKEATEDTEYNYTLGTTNGTIGIWDLTLVDSWLHWANDNNTLYGIPLNNNIGNATVRAMITDGYGRFDTKIFNITVANNPPEIIGTPPETILEGEVFNYDFNSTDDHQGADDFHWEITVQEDWLWINVDGGVTGTPYEAVVGPNVVNVTVHDGNGGNDSFVWTLNVTDVNEAPYIDSMPGLSAQEDMPYWAQFTAIDEDQADQGKLEWGLNTTTEWLKMNTTTGNLTGTPLNEHVGSVNVNIWVKDLAGAGVYCNFTLRVENANDAPTWKTVPGDTTITAGDTYEFQVDFEDVDVGDAHNLGISSEPSSFAVIDLDGNITWQTYQDTIGTFVFNVSVSDGHVTISHLFNITVEAGGPTTTLLSPIDGATVLTLAPLLEWEIGNPNNDTIGSKIFLSEDDKAVSALGESVHLATVQASGTEFTVTPPLTAGKTYYWTVLPVVQEVYGVCISHMWSFTISDSAVANTVPVITTIGELKGKEGEDFEYTIIGTDADAWDTSNLSFSLIGEPSGMTIDPSTGRITWTPEKGQEGKYTATVRLTDGKDTVTEEFTIEIEKAGGGSGGGGGEDLFAGMLPILLVVIMIIVVAVVLAAVMSKKKRPADVDDGSEEDWKDVDEKAQAPVATTKEEEEDEQSTIDDLFIIYKDGRLIAHHTRKIKPDLDKDLMGGMFTALQEFIKTSLGDEEKVVNEIAYGDSRVLIEHGQYLYLATAITGEIGLKAMHKKMRRAVDEMEEAFENILKDWDGDIKPLKGAKVFLKPLLE